MTEGTKYHPLFEHLLFAGHGQTTMTFAEIEAVLGARLPPSAHNREEWWSNSPSGHSQARAWMRAGYSTSQVNLARRTVTFTLDGWPEGYARSNFFGRGEKPLDSGLAEGLQAELGADPGSAGKGAIERDHPLFGIWKGKVTLDPGYDYSKPAFDPDDELAG